MFAADIMDTVEVEWLFANWKLLAWLVVGGGLTWMYSPNLKAALANVKLPTPSPARDDTPSPIDPDPDWLESDHRAALFAALCLLNDHAIDIGDKDAIEHCKALMPSVMTPCAEPEPTE